MGAARPSRGDLTESLGQTPEVFCFLVFSTLRAWSHSPLDTCSVPDPTPPRHSSLGTVAPLRSTHINLIQPYHAWRGREGDEGVRYYALKPGGFMGLVQANLQLTVPSLPTQGSPSKADLARRLRGPYPTCLGDPGLSPPPVSHTWKLRPCGPPSQEGERPGSRGATQATEWGGLSGLAGHTQRERPSLRVGVGDADSTDPSPKPSGAWTSARPLSTARSARGHPCARYPSEETEAWRRAVLCKVTRG